MTQFGRIIVLVGLAIVAVGAVIWVLGRLGFRGLPGDVAFESQSVKVYFPIVTCLVLSVVVSVVLWIARTFVQRP